jgi:hypothetical protein
MSLDDSPAYWVGPHFVKSDFDGAPTMEQGVVLFADSVWGWQLDPAENLMRANPHAGLAVLSIVVSYFERIAQFRKGVVDGRGRSAELFKEGVAWVLEDMADREANERLADRLYDAVRGGDLPTVLAELEAHGSRTYLAPDRYAWRIETTGDADTYVFDGSVVRSFVGDAEVAVDASPTAALRSHARWTGVVLLEGLDTAGVSVAELPPADLPAGREEARRPDGPHRQRDRRAASPPYRASSATVR